MKSFRGSAQAQKGAATGSSCRRALLLCAFISLT